MRIALAILCILFDITYIYFNKKEKNIIGLITKVLAATCFICIGYLGFKENKIPFTYAMLIGLILDGLGDLFLAIRNLYAKNAMFLIGTILFMFGHVLYISALLLLNNNYLLMCAAIGVVIGLFAYLIFRKFCSFEGAILYVGVVYSVMLMSMFSLSVGVYFTFPAFNNLVFMLGALLFASSDCILIFYNFGEKKDWMHPTYSMLYFVAQILIGLSLHL